MIDLSQFYLKTVMKNTTQRLIEFSNYDNSFNIVIARIPEELYESKGDIWGRIVTCSMNDLLENHTTEILTIGSLNISVCEYSTGLHSRNKYQYIVYQGPDYCLIFEMDWIEDNKPFSLDEKLSLLEDLILQ